MRTMEKRIFEQGCIRIISYKIKEETRFNPVLKQSEIIKTGERIIDYDSEEGKRLVKEHKKELAKRSNKTDYEN